MDTLASMIEEIKAKIIKKKLYGIKTATCTQDLCNAVYPIYKTFYVKKSQDNLVVVQSFFALIRQFLAVLIKWQASGNKRMNRSMVKRLLALDTTSFAISISLMNIE